jgi:hypothetical protein
MKQAEWRRMSQLDPLQRVAFNSTCCEQRISANPDLSNLFDLQARLHQDNDVGVPRGENVVHT